MTRAQIVAAVVVLLVFQVHAQLVLSERERVEGPPQFRTGTALVVVDVVATSLDGNVARELTAADFEILEDGKPQAIKTFQFISLEEAPASELLPGVFANTREPGAIFALVIDELKIDVQHTAVVRRWARRLIEEHVRPHDHAAVLRSGHTSGLLFSSDQAFLRSLVEQVSPRRAQSAMAGLVSGAEQFATGLTDTIGRDTTRDTEDSLFMLRQLVERLGVIPARRKAVFWFSQGVAVELDQISGTDGAGNNSYRAADALRELLAAARRGNVAIYGIDPRGLEADASVTSADHGGMRDIAEATGGRVLVNTNDLASGLQRMVRENRAYYLLGYEPADQSADRRARKLEVRTRSPGVRLLHRRAYVPDPASATTPVDGSLAAVLPGGELAIAMTPSVVIDPKGQLVVSVPFELSALQLDQRVVTFTLAALSLTGKPARAVTGKLSVVGSMASDRARLRLEPGWYQLRLAAETAGRAQQGVAFATIDVPSAASSDPRCGGFLLMQGDKPPRPSVTRRLNRAQSIAGVMVVSAQPSFRSLPLELAIASSGSAASDRRLTLPAAREFKKGYWNVEFTVPPLPTGRAEMTLVAGGRPLTGCSTTVDVQ